MSFSLGVPFRLNPLTQTRLPLCSWLCLILFLFSSPLSIPASAVCVSRVRWTAAVLLRQNTPQSGRSLWNETLTSESAATTNKRTIYISVCLCRCTGGGESSHCSVQCQQGFSITVVNGRGSPPNKASPFNEFELCMSVGRHLNSSGSEFSPRKVNMRLGQQYSLPANSRVVLQSLVPLLVTFCFILFAQYLRSHFLMPSKPGASQLHVLWTIRKPKQNLYYWAQFHG